jgi:hypothetical protein
MPSPRSVAPQPMRAVRNDRRRSTGGHRDTWLGGIALMIGKIFMSLSSRHPPRRSACWSGVDLIFDEERAAPGAL